MPNPYLDIRTQQLPGLGRRAVLDTVLRKIQEGNHVSIVSPRYMGKSCFIRALAAQPVLRDRFEGIAVCDVRHDKFPSNEALFAYVLKKLETDPFISADWKEFTKPEGSASSWDTLHDLGKGLACENARMLIILDGLDHLALNSQVDEGAWNNLNSLIDSGGVQFVTASCDELDDILLDPQSRGSLFFQRFGASISLPPVDIIELNDWLKSASCGASGFDKAAQSELLAQSGGHPKLLAMLLSRMNDGAQGGQVNEMAANLVRDLASEIVGVFNELPLDHREALSTLEEAGHTTPQARKALLSRGFVRVGRNDRLEQSCQMIARLAELSRPGESTMKALFGDEDAYFKNMAHALQLRLKAVAGSSQGQIFRHIGRIIENLDAVDFAMNGGMRPLEDEVIKVVERLVGTPFPALNVTNPPRGFRWAGQDHRSHNVRVVENLTREECGYSNPKLPRSIYLLLSSIHDAGNYATHHQGQPLSRGFGFALVTSALELAAEMKCSGLIN
jgi:hypothetical protein